MSFTTPSNLKILNRNPGHRPLNLQEPDPPYLTDLTPPPFLTSERAREVWNYLAPIAAKNRMLCETDVMPFAAYCEAWAEYWCSQQRVSTHFAVGGTPVIEEEKPYWYPWIRLRDKALEQVERGTAHFGLTPMTRTKIRTQPQADLFPADFESFLRSVA